MCGRLKCYGSPNLTVSVTHLVSHPRLLTGGKRGQLETATIAVK